MSHTSSVSTITFADENILRTTIAELKARGVRCDLLENAKPRAYYTEQAGMNTPARFTVHLPDSRYDVGLYPLEGKPGFEARFDEFAGSVASVLGASTNSRGAEAIGKLAQTYARLAITRKAIQSGSKVTQTVKEDGTIQLVITA